MHAWIKIFFHATVITASLGFVACEDECKDDPDCVFINDGQGGHYEEIDFEDGECDCA